MNNLVLPQNRDKKIGFSFPLQGVQAPPNSSSYSIEEIINNLEQLERLALLYQEKTGHETTVNEMMLQYLRNSHGKRPAFTGNFASSFVAFVNSHNPELSCYFFRENIRFPDPLTGNEVNLLHLLTTLNKLMSEITWSEEGIISISRADLSNLAGWANELQALVIAVIKETQNSSDYHILYGKTTSLLGGDTKEKLLADIDAWNIYNRLTTMSLPNAFRDYYLGEDVNRRYAEFTCYRDQEQIRQLSGRYTSKWFIWPIKKWPNFSKANVTRTQALAVSDALIPGKKSKRLWPLMLLAKEHRFLV